MAYAPVCKFYVEDMQFVYRFWIERRIAKIAGFLGIFLFFQSEGTP